MSLKPRAQSAEMEIVNADVEASWGDAVRVIVALVCTVIVLALLSEPPVKAWGLLAGSLAVLIVSVMTARSRAGVIGGVLAIIVFRLGVAAALNTLQRLSQTLHR
jgi:hypothetical protein